jgi:hypothetical protein
MGMTTSVGTGLVPSTRRLIPRFINSPNCPLLKPQELQLAIISMSWLGRKSGDLKFPS